MKPNPDAVSKVLKKRRPLRLWELVRLAANGGPPLGGGLFPAGFV
jgi:hypothetical protein